MIYLASALLGALLGLTQGLLWAGLGFLLLPALLWSVSLGGSLRGGRWRLEVVNLLAAVAGQRDRSMEIAAIGAAVASQDFPCYGLQASFEARRIVSGYGWDGKSKLTSIKLLYKDIDYGTGSFLEIETVRLATSSAPYAPVAGGDFSSHGLGPKCEGSGEETFKVDGAIVRFLVQDQGLTWRAVGSTPMAMVSMVASRVERSSLCLVKVGDLSAFG